MAPVKSSKTSKANRKKTKKAKTVPSKLKAKSPKPKAIADEEEQDEDEERNGDQEWGGVNKADEENDVIHGFSTDDDDSSDDENFAEPSEIDVGRLPTIAKDGATVKGKLEKAKRRACAFFHICQKMIAIQHYNMPSNNVSEDGKTAESNIFDQVSSETHTTWSTRLCNGKKFWGHATKRKAGDIWLVFLPSECGRYLCGHEEDIVVHLDSVPSAK
ncbi:hypothetical protein K435DRAFT_873312 [Dendrothele bispora CBS 962.96]|uniref:Uncharacterized protein n=1 Tax=Dendrothele bispora (strain CBS 962.96) TaxID=1314807 RepID=A0A4V4HC12_DENBC|nr:hypothetical protein K435DRAFT_873312 [Dendrothele bispora CBS 962.96]